MQYMRSVSYTHLDVYKRQEWNGKHKGIDDYLAAIKQKEGTGAQTSALPKGEQS